MVRQRKSAVRTLGAAGRERASRPPVEQSPSPTRSTGRRRRSTSGDQSFWLAERIGAGEGRYERAWSRSRCDPGSRFFSGWRQLRASTWPFRHSITSVMATPRVMRRRTRPQASITLGLTNTVPQRLGRTAELGSDRGDRLPLRLTLGSVTIRLGSRKGPSPGRSCWPPTPVEHL